MENKFQTQQFTAYSTFEKYNYIILSYMKKTGKVNIACVCASNKNSEWKVNLQMQLHISKVKQAMLFYLT